MHETWKEKGYWGSGSYHGDFHCENCGKKFSPKQGWYIHYEPDAFEGVYAVTNGYCSKKCLKDREEMTRD